MCGGKYIPGLAFALALSSLSAYGQYTSVVGNRVLDPTGAVLVSGSICFQATDGQDNPVSVSVYASVPLSATVVTGPLCSSVDNGAISGLQVPDPAKAFPRDFLYRVTIWDSATGESSSVRMVDVSGATFSWDAYATAHLSTMSVFSPAVQRLTSGATRSSFMARSNLPEPPAPPPISAPVKLSQLLMSATAALPGTLSSTQSAPNAAGQSDASAVTAVAFPGPDIGAKINAAYAALPATGGEIILPVPSSGYSFSTPIVFATLGKPVTLSCQSNAGPESAATLRFASKIGAAVTFDIAGATPAKPRGYGLRNCNFRGSGGISVGLFLGGKNGAFGFTDEASSFANFVVDVKYGDNAYITKFHNTYLNASAGQQTLLVPDGLNNSGEELVFEGVSFDGGGANSVELHGFGTQASIESSSIDNAQLVAAAANVTCVACHFENSGGPISYPFIVSYGNTVLIGASMSDDFPSASTAANAVTVSGGILTILGLQGSFSNAAYTSVFLLSGTASLYEMSPLHLFNNAPLVAGTTTGRYVVQNDPMCGTTSASGVCPDYVSNQPISTTSSLLAGTASSNGHPYGAYVETVSDGTAAQPQFRGLSTPDLIGYFTGKIFVSEDTPDLDGCAGPYSSRIVFATENKSAATAVDTSTPQGYVDCTGMWHLPNISASSMNAKAASFSGVLTAHTYVEALESPASSSAPCTAGQFTDDANYHYVCVSTNTWKRVALSSF